jgi:hypothetical protein
MKKSIFRKVLICGIMILFIGTSCVPSTITLTEKSHINGIEELKIRSDYGAPQTKEKNPLQNDHKISIKEIIDRPDSPPEYIEWFTYGGENTNAIGWAGGNAPLEGAIRLTPSELAPYDGWNITSVKYFHGYCWNPSPEPESYGNIKIYDAGTPTQPGVVLDSEPFYTPAGTAWFQFNLSNPVIINASHDYWYSVEILNPDAGDYPLGADDGPAVDGKGDWVFIPGDKWYELQDFGLDWNFNHMVGIESPSSPVIYGPTDGWANVNYTFRTNPISDPNGDPFYCKWDWDDGTIIEWLGPYESGSSISASHAWTNAGVYETRVKLKDPYGNENNWSNPHTINITQNEPPGIPSITGPSRGKPGTNYTYTFVTTDPDSDKIFYYIDWGDNNNTFYWIGPYEPGQKGTLNYSWSQQGTYTIKIRARDCHGAKSWDWGTLEVSMPRTAFINRLFERFPNAFPILRYLLGM